MEIWTTGPLVDETRDRIENAGTGCWEQWPEGTYFYFYC
jgi:hypothetical protein